MKIIKLLLEFTEDIKVNLEIQDYGIGIDKKIKSIFLRDFIE